MFPVFIDKLDYNFLGYKIHIMIATNICYVKNLTGQNNILQKTLNVVTCPAKKKSLEWEVLEKTKSRLLIVLRGLFLK